MQDIDAYNISRIYSFGNKKLHLVLNDYYNVSMKYKKRYTIFKERLLDEFGTSFIYDAILPFTSSEVQPFSWAFGAAFGECDYKEYGKVMAQAIEKKIEDLIATEI